MDDRLRPLLEELRRCTRGTMALVLDGDRHVIAVDAPHAEPARWEPVLRDIDAHLDAWADAEPRASFRSSAGVTFLIFPVGASYAFVELRPGTSLGLARLRCKPVIAELEALIAEGP